MKFFLEGVPSSNSLFLRAEFHYLTSYVLLRVARPYNTPKRRGEGLQRT